MQETTPGAGFQGTNTQGGGNAGSTSQTGTSTAHVAGSSGSGTGSHGAGSISVGTGSTAQGAGSTTHGGGTSTTGGGGSAQGAGSTSQTGGDTAQKAEQAINRIADATASSVRDVAMKGEQMRQQWMARQDAMVESSRECVRNHPLTSVAVAALAGMLFARVCGNGRRSGHCASDSCL